MNIADQILNADDGLIEAVKVKQWGTTVYVRTMSGKEIDSWQTETYNGGNTTTSNLRARLLVRCLTDETGKRIFADDQAEALGEKNTAILDHLYQIAQRLNAISDGDLEALAKKS